MQKFLIVPLLEFAGLGVSTMHENPVGVGDGDPIVAFFYCEAS
jgi:hypothetical protein